MIEEARKRMAGLKPRFFFGFSFPSAEADGKAKQSKARQGKARQGKARQSKARQDKARPGKTRQ